VDARQREIEKYREVYKKYAHYCMADDRLFPVVSVLDALFGSMLDVSCGRGELLTAARKMGFDAVGTEAVPELCVNGVQNAVITALPFDDDSFDVVTCIDVIEHILEQDIVAGLKELERVCRGTIVIAAADYPTYWDGVNLHPSARPYHEWDRLFRSVFSGEVSRIGPTASSEMWAVRYGSL
jgi:ubiquinone/menaquinone biosynthesis C-methylase UbiE